MVDTSCLIIGAGPAGLAAAIAAARGGESVIVLEKNDRPGRKLLLAGGGRANLTDPAAAAIEALEAYGREGRFLRQALAPFSLSDFLNDLDVQTQRDPDGGTYVRGGSRRLLEGLLAKAARLGVQIVSGAAVRRVARGPDGSFEVLAAAGSNWTAGRLIVATGGMTYPSTGSSGDGYRLAETLGHGVEPPRPALGALATEPNFPGLAGSVADASVTLWRDKRRLATRRGELLFTHQGLSGPSVLEASLELARASSSAEETAGIRLVADLCPDATREGIVEGFLAAARVQPKRRLANAGAVAGLSARLLDEFARQAGVEANRNLGGLSRQLLAALAGKLKSLTVTVSRPLDPNVCMVTLGGVATKGLDPYTMASRISPGVAFAGEVLSPAGGCGGYNLLMAFATGLAAGAASVPHRRP